MDKHRMSVRRHASRVKKLKRDILCVFFLLFFAKKEKKKTVESERTCAWCYPSEFYDCEAGSRILLFIGYPSLYRRVVGATQGKSYFQPGMTAFFLLLQLMAVAERFPGVIP